MQNIIFKNIEEIKFTKVGEDTYSISIKSDLESEKMKLNNAIFESSLCKIDSSLSLNLYNNYELYDNGGDRGRGRILSIPIEVKLLPDYESKKLYTIRCEE